MILRASVLVALTVLVLPCPALADVLPDPDSADAHCTLAEQCPGGTFCEYSFNPGRPEPESEKVGEDCRREATVKGLELRCRNGGNYGGKHLYCPKGETGSWSPPGQKTTPEPTPTPTTPATPATPNSEAPKTSGCSVAGDAGAAGLLGLLGALWLTRRRRA